MIAELRRATLSGVERGPLRGVLNAAPWLWPDASSPNEWARARQLAGAAPPGIRPGQAPLLSVSAASAAIWTLNIGGAGHHGLETADFGGTALESWRTACRCVPRALPLLWSSLRVMQQIRITAGHLYSVPLGNGQVAVPPRLLDGASFGLSFVLAIASQLLRCPLPGDLVASAQVDAIGSTARVEGLQAKLLVVLDAAPMLTRVLVARTQIEEAAIAIGAIATLVEEQHLADGTVRVTVSRRFGSALVTRTIDLLPVSSAAEAVSIAFGRQLGELLVSGGDPANRVELTQEFLRLSLQGRSGIVDWSPVARAADLALRTWGDIDAETRFLLEFSRAVAGRHEGLHYEIQLPTETWIRERREPTRSQILAHLVQHAADAGTPDPAQIVELADRLIGTANDLSLEQLKVIGATARLKAVTGRPFDSMREQATLSREYVTRMEESHASYPLSEWFRLAGACGDPGAFGEADVFWTKNRERLDADGQPYVQLARSRAAVCLGLDLAGARRDLGELAANLAVPAHLRWSACRWYSRAVERVEEQDPIMGALRHAALSTESSREATLYLTLTELDRALAARDEAASAQALQRLEQLDGPIVRHLSRANPAAAAQAVATFYPY